MASIREPIRLDTWPTIDIWELISGTVQSSCPPKENLTDKRYVLAVVMLSSFLTPFMASSVNVALPSISKEFSMSAVLLTWVATSYLLAAATFLVPFGRLADIRGRRSIFIAGMWVFLASSALCVLAPTSYLLIFFRVVQGIGAAMTFGTAIAILTSVYPPNQRGQALGMTTAMTYVGLSLGPFLGGFLTAFLSWRSIFAVVIPIAGAIIFLSHSRLKGEWGEACGERFDLAGSVVYAISLTAVIFGFSMLPGFTGAAITLAGTAGMVTFVLLELRRESPVMDMTFWRRNRAFAFSNLAALINYSATFAVTFLMSLYLQDVKQFSAEKAGIILVSQPIVMATFSPIAGRLSDRIEPQVIASIGMAITAAGLLLLSQMTESTAVWAIVGSLAFIGFGFALFSSPNTNAVMSSVERKSYGVASASLGTMRLVGQVLSLGIATIFISLYLGSQEITHALADQFMQSYKLSFALFAVMCFIGVFASLARGRVR
jgi:EmrB/QacA subfamily drug resistance transporter